MNNIDVDSPACIQFITIEGPGFFVSFPLVFSQLIFSVLYSCDGFCDKRNLLLPLLRGEIITDWSRWTLPPGMFVPTAINITFASIVSFQRELRRVFSSVRSAGKWAPKVPEVGTTILFCIKLGCGAT